MMHISKRAMFVLVLLLTVNTLACTAGSAVNFTIETEPSQIRANEPFHLIITVNDTIMSFQSESTKAAALKTDDFKPIGNNPSKNMEQNWVNGSFSGKTTYNYLLVPLKTGKLTIMPFAITAGGVTYYSDTIRITVGTARISADDSTQKLTQADKPAKSSYVFTSLGKNIFFDDFFTDTTHKADGVQFNHADKVYMATAGRQFNVTYSISFVNIKGVNEGSLANTVIKKLKCPKGIAYVSNVSSTTSTTSYAHGKNYDEETKIFVVTLNAYKAGSYTIPAATVSFGKKKYVAPPVAVIVR